MPSRPPGVRGHDCCWKCTKSTGGGYAVYLATATRTNTLIGNLSQENAPQLRETIAHLSLGTAGRSYPLSTLFHLP